MFYQDPGGEVEPNDAKQGLKAVSLESRAGWAVPLGSGDRKSVV